MFLLFFVFQINTKINKIYTKFKDLDAVFTILTRSRPHYFQLRETNYTLSQPHDNRFQANSSRH